MRNVSDRFGENIQTQILCSVTFSEDRTVYEMTWKYRSFATTLSQQECHNNIVTTSVTTLSQQVSQQQQQQQRHNNNNSVTTQN